MNDNFAPTPARPSLPDILKRINELRSLPDKSIEAFARIGRELLAVKESLGHGHWMGMFRSRQFPFSLRTAQMWMGIAANEYLCRPDHRNQLPRYVHTLYELSQADSATLKHGILQGGITPVMARAQAKKFVTDFKVPSYRPARKRKPFNTHARIAILDSRIMAESARWPVEHRGQLAVALGGIANRMLHEIRNPIQQ